MFPTIPAGVEEARTITEGVDALLMNGFGRLGKAEIAALDALGSAVSATPLGSSVQTAIAALQDGELLAHHLAMVAAARASIEGARYDAVLEVAAAELDLKVLEPSPEVGHRASAEAATIMESVRQWLVEIALAGLAQLESATIAPAVTSLRSLQDIAELRRLAALLTGFAQELLDAAPTSALAEVPSRRWTDLWCQALLGTYAVAAEPARHSVSGVLFPLGADVRHHDHLLSVLVHGLLESDGERLLVRTTLSAWKVDAVTGDEIWRLISDSAPELVQALAKPSTIALEDATLLDGGDLLWDGQVKVGEAFQPWEVDLKGATVCAPLPRDRHVLQIALPVLVTGKELLDDLDLLRVSPHAHLSEKEVQSAKAWFGLVRFDDAFRVQPLATFDGKKMRGPAEGIEAAAKVKNPALDILRERASKLLRA